jgi:DNA-binding XRE family transcriptional regulator
MDTVAQLRAARAMVRMTQSELAEAAGVSVETVKRIETTVGDLSANTVTVAALRKVLEGKGIVFVPGNGGPPGVRFREPGE